MNVVITDGVILFMFICLMIVLGLISSGVHRVANVLERLEDEE